MCGFAGFTGFLERRDEIINKMNERIIHRGPDMGNTYLGDGITLGFRRLSILDLRPDASQPMVSADGRSVIVFNGEIYNFRELRAELEKFGISFNTTCDTEVLLAGYRYWGKDIVNRLRGMFAFAIWDIETSSLFGARDMFGIKPFYYTVLEDGNLLFGSEIKSFLEHPDFVLDVNPKALRPYLTFQYSADEETFFKGVYKLPQAHSFSYKDGKLTIYRYSDMKFEAVENSFEHYVNETAYAVQESVDAHSVSDVKVGAFLSGGVDSSFITASLMPNKTFSVGFDYNKFNETDYAAQLSEKLGIENHKRLLTADECFDAFSDIQYHMDEPQSNPSSVPLYFLARLASEHVTVVLSGEGADELYAGYEEYNERSLARKYRKIPGCIRRGLASFAKSLPYFKGHDFIIKNSGRPEDFFIGQAHVFDEDEAVDILNDEYKNGKSVREITAPIYARVKNFDELSKKQYLDLNLWLPGDILLKADKMSMASSLELRVPFLDKEVLAKASKIPARHKITPENTKYVLRKAANRILPDEWADREKKGFPVPIRYWLREDKYYNIVKEHFTSDYAAKFFDTSKLVSILDEHKNNTDRAHDRGRKIWTVFTFLVWYKRFFIDENTACKKA
ncbi:MAG: asparagine synthase (glutamine-hydrolyzing) [Clostridia bacterium]|nr:asparagine synthase (glutamine-hydrolyzing) [Clostridia bacterium]